VSDEIQIPEVEVVVKAYGREVAIVAFFGNADGSFTCVAGMEDASWVHFVADTLHQTARSLVVAVEDGEEYKTSQLPPYLDNGEADIPF